MVLTLEEARKVAKSRVQHEGPQWIILDRDGNISIMRDSSTYWWTMKPNNPVEHIS